MKINLSRYSVPLAVALLAIALPALAAGQSRGAHVGGRGGGGWHGDGLGWWGLGLGWEAAYLANPYLYPYYPYVPQCPEAWRLVPATPPDAVR